MQSVISKEMEMSWSDGVPNDTSSVTHNYTFIIGLGMLESSTSAIGHDRKKTILVSIDEE